MIHEVNDKNINSTKKKSLKTNLSMHSLKIYIYLFLAKKSPDVRPQVTIPLYHMQ